MKTRLMLVPSTHWDREWYKPHAEFGVHLTELFDTVLSKLDSGELSNFHTDGQAVIVEDILALKPEWKEKIADYAAKGKLEIGPFYSLADMYIPSGESFLRNFFCGTEIVRSLGGTPGIPYAPDAFGHNSDIPAIIRTAGFDAYFFCRGLGTQMDPPRAEFVWADKSGQYKILGLAGIVDIFKDNGDWVSGAYALAMNMPKDKEEFCERLRLFMRYLRKYSDLPVQLAMNGSDHLLPEDHLAERLEYFAKQDDDFTAETTTMAEYVSEAWKALDMDALQKITGELTYGRFLWVVTETGSCRTELKIRNDLSQFNLTKVIEPALAAAPEHLRGIYQPHLDHAWKMLLQNQTHDSLPGCSPDPIHREMQVRFDQIEYSMQPVIDRLLRVKAGITEPRKIMPKPDAEIINAVVTHCAPAADGSKIWNFTVICPVNINLNDYELIDDKGNKWDFILIETAPASTTNGPFIPSGAGFRDCSKLNIYTNLPIDGGWSSANITFRKKTNAVAENNNNFRFPVTVSNGKLELDFNSAKVSDFFSFADMQDKGDEYMFFKTEDALVRTNTEWKQTGSMIRGDLYMIDFETSLALPASIQETELKDVTVKLKVLGSIKDDSFITMWEVDNTAKDHRLQLKINTPFAFDEYCRQTQFQHLITPTAKMDEPDPWRQKTEPIRRNHGFISMNKGEQNFTILPLGLHEHAVDGNSVMLTLFRAVSTLGCSGAGPIIYTPDAQSQCLRKFTIAFSFSGNAEKTNAQWHNMDRLLFAGNGVIIHPELTPDNITGCELKMDSETLVISAHYYDKQLQKNIIRIFNPTSLDGVGSLTGKLAPANLQKVRYDRGLPILCDETIASQGITLKSGEIATFCV